MSGQESNYDSESDNENDYVDLSDSDSEEMSDLEQELRLPLLSTPGLRIINILSPEELAELNNDSMARYDDNLELNMRAFSEFEKVNL
jgi:hypothetical protein